MRWPPAKDVYLEKPVTHSIEEGATLTKAVRGGKQVLQCGMQQRSWTHFRNAVALVRVKHWPRGAGAHLLVAKLQPGKLGSQTH